MISAQTTVRFHSTIIAIPIPKAPAIKTEMEIMDGIVVPTLGVFGVTLFVTLLVPAVAVHWSPHEKPFGQQLPPRLAAQLYQALGQPPAAVAPLGAMTTTPFVLITVLLAVGTHEPVV